MTALAPPGTAAAPPRRPGPADPAGPPLPDARFWLPGAALTLLAALLLGFALNLVVIGDLQHARAEQTGYADLRAQLALGTAPVGQTDGQGRLLALGTPVAVLDVPAIGLRDVVREGTTSGVLEDGPGHRRDTVFPGQPGTSVIMARQWAYGGPFRHLDALHTGDRIRLTTGQGVHLYTVTGLRRAGDPLPPRAAQGEGRLTLITATGGPYTPSGILRVDARLTSAVRPAPAQPLAAGSLGASEQPLRGDPAAWLPVLLWAQGLVAAAVLVTLAYRRWGRWQAWIAGFPVLAALAVALSGAAARLLPNLL